MYIMLKGITACSLVYLLNEGGNDRRMNWKKTNILKSSSIPYVEYND